MKKYVENHDAVISYGYQPKDWKDVRDGMVVEQVPKIYDVQFYYGTIENDTYTKILLSEAFITEINAEIQAIKNQSIMAEYDSLPF
jgi:hypothetical protein